MKIAYYEENNYHTEIMGTFLEPFLNDEIIVFNDIDKSGYVNWFKKQINFELKNTDDFINNYLNFDIIIIGTSTSFKFIDNNLVNTNLTKPKFFFITHIKEDHEKNINNNGFVLTPLNKINNFNYILPINNLYNSTNKVYNKITICLVGRFKDSNRNTDDLIKLLDNYNHLNFEIRIYTRHKKFIPNKILNLQNKYDTNKLKIFYKLSVEQIINSLNEITYFCPLSSKKSCYVKDRLTGMIPFSYNFNTPLLLDDETNNIYNLKTPIIYNNSLCEIIEKICYMDKNMYDKLILNIINEKQLIVKNNFKILKDDTNLIINKLSVN